jgi:hypothetical protein
VQIFFEKTNFLYRRSRDLKITRRDLHSTVWTYILR